MPFCIHLHMLCWWVSRVVYFSYISLCEAIRMFTCWWESMCLSSEKIVKHDRLWKIICFCSWYENLEQHISLYPFYLTLYSTLFISLLPTPCLYPPFLCEATWPESAVFAPSEWNSLALNADVSHAVGSVTGSESCWSISRPELSCFRWCCTDKPWLCLVLFITIVFMLVF